MMSKHVRKMHCCMVVAHHLISESGFFIMFITETCNSQWFVKLMHLSLASCTPPVCCSSCGTSYEDRKRKTRGNRKWDISKQGREGSTPGTVSQVWVRASYYGHSTRDQPTSIKAALWSDQQPEAQTHIHTHKCSISPWFWQMFLSLSHNELTKTNGAEEICMRN